MLILVLKLCTESAAKAPDSSLQSSMLPPLIMWIVIGVLCGLTVIGIVVAVIVVYCCRNNNNNNRAVHANNGAARA